MLHTADVKDLVVTDVIQRGQSSHLLQDLEARGRENQLSLHCKVVGAVEPCLYLLFNLPYWPFQFAALLIREIAFSGTTISIICG